MGISTLKIATFNIRGLDSKIRKQQLENDLTTYNIDIMCLQETKIHKGLDINLTHSRLICFPSDTKQYGNGFLINNSTADNIHRTWKVNDRICVIEITSKEKIISIINIYAPHSGLTEKSPELRDVFYEKLEETVKTIEQTHRKKAIILIAGDFNSKIGIAPKKDDAIQTTCMGYHSRGIRNENGRALIDFCEMNNMYITNSRFKHPAKHQTTWVGHRNINGQKRIIYNMIDYILCEKRCINLFTNARSYSGNTLTSDHRPVIGTMRLEWYKIKTRRPKQPKKIDSYKLASDTNVRENYQEKLDEQLRSQDNEASPQIKWNNTKNAIAEAAEQSAGHIDSKKFKTAPDTIIEQLSTKQKDLRIQANLCTDCEKTTALKTERNKILHEIKKRQINIMNAEISQKVEAVEQAPDASKMFKAVKILNRKTYENPTIQDEDGKLVTNPNEIKKIATAYYEEKFRQEQSEDIAPFQGNPRPLTKQISVDEVRKSSMKLNNSRAAGEDNVTSEMLKYGTPLLWTTMADILNSTFSTHQPLNINNGILLSLQKPGKPKGPMKNQRPVVLLTTLRKVLSLIVLDRIRDKTETFLSQSQSGFRQHRSTADVVWTHRWIAAKTSIEQMEIHITGIDMSSAFDTIDRTKLLEILDPIISEDDSRIIRFLLSNTKLSPNVINSTEDTSFNSNIGTPQGDSLSPVLFVIYLEAALRELRQKLDKSMAPDEVAYADDVDFISRNVHQDVQLIQDTLSKYNLKVNADKTEYTTIRRETSDRNQETWRNSKKVGSLLGDQEDIKRRKHLATVAMSKLNKIWYSKGAIKLTTRLKLYKALVKSVLTYNCGTWGLTKKDEQQLDTFHRKQLKRVMGIRYPTIISNKSLYEKTKEKRLSTTIREARWQLFGHILRRDRKIPANEAMKYYFKRGLNRGFRGTRRSTLPTTLSKDLAYLENTVKCLSDHNYTRSHKLNTDEDLEELREVAADRRKWKALTSRIVRAGEAIHSEECAAGRP